MRVWLLLIALALLTLTVSAQDDAADSGWCVSVWYPSSEQPGGFDVIMNNLDVIDEVNPFWYMPNADGTLSPTDDAEDADELAAWREAGLQIIPSIFASISDMIEDPDIRVAHINHIVELVERMDYDGIDIDYEGFGLHTREPFSLFIEGLAEALHANGRLLTVAVHAKTTDEGVWEGAAAQDWSRIAPAVDVFRVMTYDYSSRNEPPGPIAPPLWAADVLDYASNFTDLSRVRLGLHFYGYSWQRGTPPATTVAWETVQRWVTSFELPIERNPVDMEAYINLQVRGLPRQSIYIADAVGLDYKLGLIRERFPNLGGVSIWGIGGEDPALWDVLRDYDAGDCTQID